MFESVKKSLVQQLARRAGKTKCPDCGHEFIPFAGKSIETFTELSNCPCPACGRIITGGELGSSNDTIGPIKRTPRPEGSKIDCRPLSQNEWLYVIPRSGNSGGLLFFAIFWNLISWTVFLGLSAKMFQGETIRAPMLIVLIFPTVGLGLLYAALRQKYGTHILYVSPAKIRLERELFGWKKTRDLATRDVTEVGLKVFYTKNYQPVYGIQISSGKGAIKFGSALTEDEKKWLCGEILANLQKIRN